MTPLVRLTRHGTSLSPSTVELEQAAARFESEYVLRLPALVDAELLSFVQNQIEIDGFTEYAHYRLKSHPVDLGLNQGRASALLLLVANDPPFLDFMRALTRQSRIRSFMGAVHRRIPGAGHEDAWHNDAVDGRLVALSVNLSREPYAGGVLQIRDEHEGRIVYELANTGPGDGVLFKIDLRLKHRVTPPEGRAPRTAFAGWFLADPARHVLGLAPVSAI